jgi:hypothetical protein
MPSVGVSASVRSKTCVVVKADETQKSFESRNKEDGMITSVEKLSELGYASERVNLSEAEKL